MSKNTRFIISSLLLSAGFFGVGFLEDQDRMLGIIILSLVTCLMVIWSIYESIGKNATLYTIILPSLYTLGVGLFWFLLPTTLYASLPVILLYGVGTYGLLKTMNIFAVSTHRTIALSRAAKGVGFVLTLFTSFLLYDAILSLKVTPLLSVPMVMVISFPVLLQGLWQSQLKHEIDREVMTLAFHFSFCIAAVSLILFFWPVSLIEASLFLTVIMYVLLGLGQAKVEGRLFRATIREYAFVGLITLIFMIANTSWRSL